MKKRQVSRRDVLKGALAVAPLIIPASALGRDGRVAPSERITVSHVGCGRRGRANLRGILNVKDTQTVAVCDVQEANRQTASKQVHDFYADQTAGGTWSGCDAVNDFREILARDDIDAIAISSPDHWHSVQAVTAADSGKHIYCEKPLSLRLQEGRRMVEAARRNKIVFQTGSQQRTEYGGRFIRVVELVRNGYIGQLKAVHLGLGVPPKPCHLPAQSTPESIDWEMWLGPALWRPYHEDLANARWRGTIEFGGGLQDMGAHHFDIAQWAMDCDATGPVEIIPPEDSLIDGLQLVYENGITMHHHGPATRHKFPWGITLEGTEGMIQVSRSSLVLEPESLKDVALKPAHLQLPRPRSHYHDWAESIRAQRKPAADVEVGHRTASICHLVNIGYWLGAPLHWNPQEEQFTNNPVANRLLQRPMRSPWTL